MQVMIEKGRPKAALSQRRKSVITNYPFGLLAVGDSFLVYPAIQAAGESASSDEDAIKLMKSRIAMYRRAVSMDQRFEVANDGETGDLRVFRNPDEKYVPQPRAPRASSPKQKLKDRQVA